MQYFVMLLAGGHSQKVLIFRHFLAVTTGYSLLTGEESETYELRAQQENKMSRLNQITKLEQFGMDHWMTIGRKLGDVEGVKSILQERAKVKVTIIRCLGDLKHGTALPARTEGFNPKKDFKKKGVWVSLNFEIRLLAKAKTIASVPEISVAYCDLEQAANDAEIQAELPENHIFDGVDVLLPYLAGLIASQPRGKAGDLLNDGCVNLFYVRIGSSEVTVVHVRWHSDDFEWVCCVYRLCGSRWSAGYRAFSATAVA